MRRILMVGAIAVIVTAAVPTMGGWVVVTVEDLPEHFVVGEPTRLEFTLRQHGEQLMRGRAPHVRVRPADGGWFTRGTRLEAREAGPASPGRYAVTVTPEEAGLLELTIDADFHRARSVLLPIPSVHRGQRTAMATVNRGRALFVGKGCVTCHLIADDGALAERNPVQVGPALTGRRLAAEYVARKLEDPKFGRASSPTGAEMPDLGLDASEIAALTSFLSEHHQAVGAR